MTDLLQGQRTKSIVFNKDTNNVGGNNTSAAKNSVAAVSKPNATLDLELRC